MAPLPASVCYAQELGSLGLGYPLWSPEGPGHPRDVQLGDIGIITSIGAFKSLYCTDADSQPDQQVHAVPEQFSFTDTNNRAVPDTSYLDPGVYKSECVEELTVQGGINTCVFDILTTFSNSLPLFFSSEQYRSELEPE